MSRERFLEILAVACVGLALYAAVDLFGSSSSRPPPEESEARQPERAVAQPEPQRPETPTSVAASPVALPTSTLALAGPTSTLAATTTLAIQSPTPAPAPQASEPIQEPGTYAEFENDEDRKDSLLEMQRQKFKSGMTGLNSRAERLAAEAAAAARAGRR
jgi:hypothetical protein